MQNASAYAGTSKAFFGHFPNFTSPKICAALLSQSLLPLRLRSPANNCLADAGSDKESAQILKMLFP
jgi:hypothetical protein